MTKHILGTVKFTWKEKERRTDRYGSVYLLESNRTSESIYAVITVPPSIYGKKVKLMALIKETRKSAHIGDFFRKIYPRNPNVGDLIVLGEGRIFTKKNDDHLEVGVLPEDGRSIDWMNPRSLYDCHDQTVDIIAQEI